MKKILSVIIVILTISVLLVGCAKANPLIVATEKIISESDDEYNIVLISPLPESVVWEEYLPIEEEWLQYLTDSNSHINLLAQIQAVSADEQFDSATSIIVAYPECDALVIVNSLVSDEELAVAEESGILVCFVEIQ